MGRFKYVRLHYNAEQISVKTPHKGVWERILTRIQASVPDAKVQSKAGVHRITKLRGRDLDIGNQILLELCSEGWEPFAVTKYHSGYKYDTGFGEAVHFRLQEN